MDYCDDLSQVRFTLAFYGVCGDTLSIQKFYSMCVDFLADLSLTPTTLAVHGVGHTSKLGDFKRLYGRLRKSGFSQIEGFELIAAFPNAEYPGSQFFVKSLCLSANNGYAAVAVPATDGDIAKLLTFSEMIISELEPEYGIGYRRTLSQGPTSYALGVTQGLPIPSSPEEWALVENICKWPRIGMAQALYRKGIIREVYPWNCLSASQLRRKIGSTTLPKWIEESADRGTLRKVGKRTIWEIPEAEIPAVRATLSAAGIIFDYRDFE